MNGHKPCRPTQIRQISLVVEQLTHRLNQNNAETEEFSSPKRNTEVDFTGFSFFFDAFVFSHSCAKSRSAFNGEMQSVRAMAATKKQLSFLSSQFLFCVVFISFADFFLFEKLLNCSCGTLSADGEGALFQHVRPVNGSCWFWHTFADTMNSILMALWVIVRRMATPLIPTHELRAHIDSASSQRPFERHKSLENGKERNGQGMTEKCWFVFCNRISNVLSAVRFCIDWLDWSCCRAAYSIKFYSKTLFVFVGVCTAHLEPSQDLGKIAP